MCEVLGCTPSELREKHPNMTVQDYYFLTNYSTNKMREFGEILGLRKQEGTMSKSPPKFRKR
jgi:hypothetical protein